jgi:hypothetical protein
MPITIASANVRQVTDDAWEAVETRFITQPTISPGATLSAINNILYY